MVDYFYSIICWNVSSLALTLRTYLLIPSSSSEIPSHSESSA